MGADLDGIVLGAPTQGTASDAKKGKRKMGATMVTWDVGNMSAGDSESLTVTVTTGWNAKAKKGAQQTRWHEFTEAETGHDLDGGASATYWYGDPAMEYESPETEPLTVDVVEPSP